MKTLNELQEFVILMDRLGFDEVQMISVSEEELENIKNITYPETRSGAVMYNPLWNNSLDYFGVTIYGYTITFATQEKLTTLLK